MGEGAMLCAGGSDEGAGIEDSHAVLRSCGLPAGRQVMRSFGQPFSGLAF